MANALYHQTVSVDRRDKIKDKAQRFGSGHVTYEERLLDNGQYEIEIYRANTGTTTNEGVNRVIDAINQV